MAPAGHARHPCARPARSAARHDPALPHLLGDLPRRAQDVKRIDRPGEPTGHRRPGRGTSMTENTARAMIRAHFEASNIGAAGGAPADDIARASEIYADDAVLEWPQGGERIRGKANIIGFRSTYPARQQFELHRTTGCHDLWVNEYTIRYDDRPVMVVGIMEFRDDKVVRERIYFGDPWEPPAWHAQWVERFDPREHQPRERRSD